MREYYTRHAAPDLLLPVPLHNNRLRTRGYNQAAEIAKTVSVRCKIPLNTTMVRRTKDTLPQTGIGTASDRLNNLHNAFQAGALTSLKNVKRIAIIDDVVTTMATIMALSDAIRSAGVETVEIWCIARASR